MRDTRIVFVVIFLTLMATGRTASAEEVVRTVDWQVLASTNMLVSGTVIAATDSASGPSLRIAHTDNDPATFHLVTIEHPRIGTARYALKGRIRHVAVAAGSYLEMWSHLPDGAFFSRALEQSGPMGRLDGSSEWREFLLPFFNQEGGSPPEQLVFNLVLSGAGTVEIGSTELVQFGPADDLFASSTGWWSDRQAGLMGGIAGSALGILGAAIGWLSSAGRARGFVFGALKTGAYFGVALVILGGLALASGQPYAVYYPLLLLGTISTVLGLWLPRSMSKRYEELELRRMQALDA